MVQKETLRWRRFSHASYAVFASLRKEVTIGVLGVAMLASVDAKATNSADTVSVATDREMEQEEQLDALEVTASRVPMTSQEAVRLVSVLDRADIAAAAVHSINDLLDYACGVDVRQRGDMGVQTDISIRGGTFDQITLLLNGVNITSPQTGHLSADFPVSMQDVERVEILEGPAARLFGTSAFSGAINIVTRCDNSTSGNVGLFGGQYGYGGANASVNVANGGLRQNISGGYSRTDGATENSEFDQWKGFYRGEYENDATKADWQCGFSQQSFGANTFYSAAFPNQWESTRRLILSARAESKGKIHLAPSVSWVRAWDNYQLIRDSSYGENFHRTDVYSVNLNAWTQWQLGRTSFGAEIRNEGIVSSALGKPMVDDSVKVWGKSDAWYRRRDNRTNIAYYLEHDILLRQWTISLGALLNNNTANEGDIAFYPGIDICYRPSESWKIFASWNKALRMPTFIDLYYKSPTNEGNLDLRSEETSSFNLGAKWRRRGFRAEVSAFYLHGTDMIDWVMYSADDVYHSANFELDNMGAELSGAIFFREYISPNCPLNTFRLSYAYITQEREDDKPIFKSNYALEYLRHKLVARLDSRIYKNLNASVAYRWQEREGAYILYDKEHKNTGKLVAYDPYGVLDLRLSWDAPRYSIYAEANNLLDQDYYDLGNVPQPGLWVKAGLNVKIF